MRALLSAALVSLWAQCCLGFFFSPGSYREARQNYHEIMSNCEREGGECLDVDFGTTDPPTEPPTPATTTTPRPRPTTRAPQPPVWFNWNPFWPFIPTARAPYPTSRAPRPTTRSPRPVTLAPRPTTRAPRPTTRAPRPTTRAPRPRTQAPETEPTTQAPVKRARKVGKGRRQKQNRNLEEQEIEVRKRRQVADPWDYLYNECTGGWEFDLGCGARGGNVCCYKSSSNSYK